MPRPLQPEDLWKVRFPTAPVVSPDGRRVAFCLSEPCPDEGKWFSHVFLVETDATRAAPLPLTRGPHQNSHPRFWPDGRWLAFVSDRKDRRQVWRIPLAGGEPEQLTSVDGEVQDFEIAPDGRWLLLRVKDAKSEQQCRDEKVRKDAYVYGEHWQFSHLHEFDLASRRARRLTRGRFDVANASLSPDGRRIAYIAAADPTFNGRYFQSRLVLLDRRTGRHRDVRLDAARIWFAERPVWSPDSKRIAFSASASPDMPFWQVVWTVPVAGGSPQRVLPDLDRPHYSPEFASTGNLQVVVLDSVDARLFRIGRGGRLQALSPAGGVVGAQACGPEGMTVFQHSRSTAAPELHFLARPGAKPRQLTDANRALRGVRMHRARRIRYRVDDLVVEALLKTPEGKGPFPLILHPHGGPQAATVDSFQPHHELLLRRGYALLMPNFRGSTGRGRDYLQRIIGDWGSGPMRDILAGVDSCVERRIADPQRLGIYGGSYGGYITAWTIAHDHRFRAAIAQCAVIDHISMYGTTDIPTFMELNLSGPPHRHFATWWEQSPIAHVGRVRTPTLVITGLADERVHPTQSSEYYRHLQATGTKTQLVLFPREGHSITEPHHVLDLWSRVADWFDRYLKKPRRRANK